MRNQLLTLFTGVSALASAVDKPNVIVVYTDEHNYKTIEAYLPLLNESQRHPWGENVTLTTPNLNKLGQQGVMMNSCYVTTPVSTPSRASLMTGLYTQKTNCTMNDLVLDVTLPTMATTFAKHGYATGYFGKWHLSGTPKPGWDPDPNYGWEDNRYMMNRGHYKSIKDGNPNPIVPNNQGDVLDGYEFMTDYLTDKALTFIKDNKANPFLCFLSIPDPHGPNVVSEPYYDMYRGYEFDKPESAKKDMTKYPGWASGKITLTQDDMRNYWGMVRCIDDNVGRILTTLSEEQLEEKTIIVFTSDHGDMCGEHGREDKSVPMESSMKVPFMVYAPFLLPQGHVVEEAVSNIDIYPTLVDLCGIEMEGEVDGISILPLLLKQEGYKGRNITFSRSTGGSTGWICVATDRYKLVHTTVNADEPWLIDLEVDPEEYVNFYNNPAYAEVVEDLSARLIDYATVNKDDKLNNNKIRQELGLEPLEEEGNGDDDSNTGTIPVVGENIILNGKFENITTVGSAKIPVDWDVVVDPRFPTAASAGKNGIGYSMSMKLGVADKETECGISQTFKVEPNQTYFISGYYYYGAVPTNGHNVVLDITDKKGDKVLEYIIPAVGTLGNKPMIDDASIVHTLEFTPTVDEVTLTYSSNKSDKVFRMDNVAVWKKVATSTEDMEDFETSHFQQYGERVKVGDDVVTNRVLILDIEGKAFQPNYVSPNTIDLSEMAEGVYFISGTLNNGDRVTAKLFKTR